MALTTSEYIAECAYVYKELYDEAEVDSSGVATWEGTITKWFMTKNIPIGKYSKIMHGLKMMGCIEVTNSGNRYNPSIYVLKEEPTVQLYVKAKAAGGFNRPIQKNVSKIELRLKTCEDRIATLEKQIEMLMGEFTVDDPSDD